MLTSTLVHQELGRGAPEGAAQGPAGGEKDVHVGNDAAIGIEGNIHFEPSKDEHVGNEAAIGTIGDVHSRPPEAGNSAKGLSRGPAKLKYEEKA